MLRTTPTMTDETEIVLYDADGNPVPGAILLDSTIAGHLVALAALRSAPLAPVGDDPKRVSAIKPKTTDAYVRRDNGKVQDYKLAVSITKTLKTAGPEPKVV